MENKERSQSEANRPKPKRSSVRLVVMGVLLLTTVAMALIQSKARRARDAAAVKAEKVMGSGDFTMPADYMKAVNKTPRIISTEKSLIQLYRWTGVLQHYEMRIRFLGSGGIYTLDSIETQAISRLKAENLSKLELAKETGTEYDEFPEDISPKENGMAMQEGEGDMSEERVTEQIMIPIMVLLQLQNDLGLDPAQKKKTDVILEKQLEDAMAFFGNRAEWTHERIDALREKYDGQLKEVLSEEQFEEFRKMRNAQADAQAKQQRGATANEPSIKETSVGPLAIGRVGRQGLQLNKKGAFQGFTLFGPIGSTSTYLVNMEGKVVHEWPSEFRPALSVYLLNDGSILRTLQSSSNDHFRTARPARGGRGGGGGRGGRVQRISWDGKVLWDFVLSRDQYMPHHDIEPLPNGNILMVAHERRSAEESIAAGRNPRMIFQGELWPDTIVEVKPTGPNSGEVVWQWRAWDHVIQDFDKSKNNFGDVAAQPERIDFNYARRGNADWLHINGVDYNPELDQIMLTVHHFGEIWIFNHDSTTAEAAGRKGDLLYRWGNPATYRAGTLEDQQLFSQHDARWIEPGQPGAGNILIFNNGTQRADGAYSSVDEIAPPLNKDGSYKKAQVAFGPTKPLWTYTAPNKRNFYSPNISGAHRLPNGNTMICSGAPGILFEVTAKGDEVWKYFNPIGRTDQGGPSSPQKSRPNNRPGRPPVGIDAPGPRPVFRATRIEPEHPALKGRKLVPGK